jgi:hypothetical protein
MHLANPQELKTCKGLKPPAARLAGTVHQVLSRLIISLEKMGVSDAWRVDQLLMQKPNRKLLILFALSLYFLIILLFGGLFCSSLSVFFL